MITFGKQYRILTFPSKGLDFRGDIGWVAGQGWFAAAATLLGAPQTLVGEEVDDYIYKSRSYMLRKHKAPACLLERLRVSTRVPMGKQ